MPKLSDILQSISPPFIVSGKINRYITKVSPIDDADGESISYCDRVELIRESKAGVILHSGIPKQMPNTTLIHVENPRQAFVDIIYKYFMVDIGEPQLNSGVWIYPNVKIGKNVIIRPGTVIGGKAVGFYAGEKDEFVAFPQIGGVIIEDDVEIGCNTCIDRGAVGDTVIGQGSKIDNLVHIAHNVKIGRECFVVALSGIGGSAKIGDYTWIGFQSCVRDWVNVGKRVIVGMCSAVVNDVPNDAIVTGVPAKQTGENIPFRRMP